nr:MAG TPA: hypothetical protein [Caudoviricetes sp.]
MRRASNLTNLAIVCSSLYTYLTKQFKNCQRQDLTVRMCSYMIIIDRI